jgi:hypothetical protein
VSNERLQDTFVAGAAIVASFRNMGRSGSHIVHKHVSHLRGRTMRSANTRGSNQRDRMQLRSLCFMETLHFKCSVRSVLKPLLVETEIWPATSKSTECFDPSRFNNLPPFKPRSAAMLLHGVSNIPAGLTASRMIENMNPVNLLQPLFVEKWPAIS